MSYESEVLTDLPVVYYRLDQLGFGVDNETVPDLSGNGLDAELVFVGASTGETPAPVWGWPSPIETDSSSREFWGYTNASIYGFPLNGKSCIRADSDGSMQPSPKDFTIEEWLRPIAPLPLATNMGMSGKQGTGGTLLTFFGGANGSGSPLGDKIGVYCFDSAGTLWVAADASFNFDDHLGESFHVVGVRSGDALALYVNGTLRKVTTIASGLPTRFTSGDFQVHSNTLLYSNARHDEVAWYNYALTTNRITAHYEAALNELTMRTECVIRLTATLDGSDDPDPVAYSFRHNWEKPVIERFRWRSSVFRPTNGSCELTRQRSAPRRQIEYQHLLYSEKLRRQFEARAFGGRTTLVQFEPDKVRVGDLSVGATSVALDTRYRDFEVGQSVLVYQDDDHYEFSVLTAVTDDGIEFEALSRSYVRPWVKPARAARLPTEQQLDAVTDVYGDASTIYELNPEDEPLNPRRVIPFTPTLTYHGREVFDLREWQGSNYDDIPAHAYRADRFELDAGTGVVSTKQYRWGAEHEQPYSMNLKGRELIAKYLGWLYARAGQSNPFWMPTFRQDLRPLSRQGSQLLVEGNEYSNLYAASTERIDLAFVYLDNTYALRRVVDSKRTDDGDQLYLDSGVPTLANLRWLSFLRRVVLSSDDVEIAWETDSVVRVAFAVVDAPLDQALGSPSMSPSVSASLSHSHSPSQSSSPSISPSGSASPSFSESPSRSPSASQSISPSSSTSPSASVSPSHSTSPSSSISPSVSPSGSASPSGSQSPSSSDSPSASASVSPSSSLSPSRSPSSSMSPSF